MLIITIKSFYHSDRSGIAMRNLNWNLDAEAIRPEIDQVAVKILHFTSFTAICSITELSLARNLKFMKKKFLVSNLVCHAIGLNHV